MMFSLSAKPLVHLKQPGGLKVILSSLAGCPTCSRTKSSPNPAPSHQSFVLLDCRSAPFSTSCLLFQNHYEVLGITQAASSKEIKDAYLQLSKELHPDKHQSGEANGTGNGDTSANSSDQQKEIHDRFVAVNMAYEVLSKPRSKEVYDLSLSRDPADPEHPNRGFYRYREYPDFHDRARAMGYTIDHDFYKKNRNHGKMVWFCILLMIFGFTIRAAAALYKKREWERLTKELNELRKIEESRRPTFSTKEELVTYLKLSERERRSTGAGLVKLVPTSSDSS